MQQRIKVITYATQWTDNLKALQESAQKHGMDLTILGVGEVWKGFGSKIIATYDYLKTLQGYTHFIFVDGYDTLFVRPVKEVPDHILFSTEKHKWPDTDAPYSYEWSKEKPWCFLNSGVYCGAIPEYLKLIEANPVKHEDDDQRYFTALFLKELVLIDWSCVLFQSYAFEEPGDFTVTTEFINNVHKTKPAIIHFNGKTDGRKVYNMVKYATLKSVKESWRDTIESHKTLHETFVDKVNGFPELKQHRDFVEQHIFGFGERSFLWMWYLIAQELPKNFSFMEIGVFKGQTLSLIKLIADLQKKKVKRIGITPLSTEGGVWESDYERDINFIHDKFNLSKDFTILKGLSEDPAIIKEASDYEVDVLYIDGGHEERHVINDLLHYSPLVKQGGYMVIDDCCNSFPQPFGYFTGIQAVTNVVDRLLPPVTPSKEWEFQFSIVHNRVYKRL